MVNGAPGRGEPDRDRLGGRFAVGHQPVRRHRHPSRPKELCKRTHRSQSAAGPTGIAFGDGAVWVANNVDGSLSRIDVVNNNVTSRTVDAAGGAYGVAAHGKTVWISNEYAGTLSQVDTERFSLVSTVATRGAPLGLAVSGDRVVVCQRRGREGAAQGRRAETRRPGTGGEVFRRHDPVPLDPAAAYDPLLWRLLAMTNDGLVAFRRTGGVSGSLLVPDLATALPVPTDDGLTYTFRLRRVCGIPAATWYGQPTSAAASNTPSSTRKASRTTTRSSGAGRGAVRRCRRATSRTGSSSTTGRAL